MPYSTQSDILKRISSDELAQLSSETDTIDADVVTEMIATADAEIDSYVAVRYAVPLPAPPKFISTVSVSIALYRLFERRSQRLGGIPQAVKDGYENAKSILKQISQGHLSVGADPPPGPSSMSGRASFESDSREYTKDTLKGM